MKNPKVIINKVGYTKYHLLIRILRGWYISFMLKFYPPFRTKFSDDVIKGGVDELLIQRNPKNPKMKKMGDKWIKDEDDDGFECFWIVKY